MIARLILLASSVAATASWLRTALSSQTVCEPRQCGVCDRTTDRLTPAQVAEWDSDKQTVPCSRTGCKGLMYTAYALARLRHDARTEGKPWAGPDDRDGCGLVVEW